MLSAIVLLLCIVVPLVHTFGKQPDPNSNDAFTGKHEEFASRDSGQKPLALVSLEGNGCEVTDWDSPFHNGQCVSSNGFPNEYGTNEKCTIKAPGTTMMVHQYRSNR